MRQISMIAVGVLALGWTAATQAQTGSAPYNTTSPSTNLNGVPDPSAPPPADAPALPVQPVPAPSAPAAAPAAAEPAPAPPPPPPPVRVNVNPAPPTPPPLRQGPPDNNAVAQTGATVEDVPVAPLPPLNATDHGNMYQPGLTNFGWALMLGGGYEDFTSDSMRSRTSGGGAWDARLVGGTRSYVGFEAAYVGGARSLQALGVNNNSTLVSNGVEAALRLNVPVVRGSSLYEPYAFAGLGWSRYSITNYNVTVTSDFASSDAVMTVPFGIGFAYGYKAFMVDARANYTPTYYNNLLQSPSGTGTLNHWGVGGQVGFAF